MNNTDPQITTWEITLPDGTYIMDEIEWGYALTVSGIQLAQKRNRRTIMSGGTIEFVAVPENHEQNHRDLEELVQEWNRAQEKFMQTTQKREELYALYKRWLEEHLNGSVLSSLLFAAAKKGE
jgi:hypothetical protein